MPQLSTLTLFFVAAAVLLITPGPAVLYIVARSLDQGRIAGIVSTLGINFGTFFHIAAATWGISALLVQSALAFNLIKYLGAAYLIYLGIRKLLEREPAETITVVEPQPLRHLFFQGVVVNLLNPKTALFFFAFLPQFTDPVKGSVALQILFLGMLFVVMAFFSDSIYALLAGTAGNWLRGHIHKLKDFSL